jgi:hypothetical protein
MPEQAIYREDMNEPKNGKIFNLTNNRVIIE